MKLLQAALTRTMNTLGRKTKTLKDGEANLGGDHIREGLTAIISVKVPEPEFEGQTKTRLGNPEVRKILDSVLTKVRHPVPAAGCLCGFPPLLCYVSSALSRRQVCRESCTQFRKMPKHSACGGMSDAVEFPDLPMCMDSFGTRSCIVESQAMTCPGRDRGARGRYSNIRENSGQGHASMAAGRGGQDHRFLIP